jgi:hypothetical protein
MAIELTAEQDFVRFLHEDCGLRLIRRLPDGRFAALREFAYTVAVVVVNNGDRVGEADRWCYHHVVAAALALEAWDGTGEPAGWHRHPASGRRVSEDPDEIDDDGNRVGAVGVVYERG